MKILGILGGIGPEATSYFYSEIIRRLRENGNITRNTDYPQIIINSINAPELVSAEVTDNMLEPYAQGITELASLKPDYIVMVCNTIHLFRDRLIEHSGYAEISDMAQIVSTALTLIPGSICVMGTDRTVSSGLYNMPGREYVNPDTEQLTLIGRVVVNYNSTGEVKKNRDALMEIVKNRRAAGADIFIAGCTEVAELLRDHKSSMALVDTLELLVADTVRRIQAD